VLGGVQSMFTAAWDEPFALPTQESTTLALRTQQILAYETGVARTVDPLGGSYFVEALTDQMEERISAIMADIDQHGGIVTAIEEGYLQSLIADSSYDLYRALESGDRKVVGVNLFADEAEDPADYRGYELDSAGRAAQLGRLDRVKKSRDDVTVKRSLKNLRAAAGRDDVNLMPLLIDCAHAYCTVGEMVSVLKDVWGEFNQPGVF
jgi:methylmalonyl-CoA mutase, N-terminal domain